MKRTKRWKPKEGDDFFFITIANYFSFVVDCTQFDPSCIDDTERFREHNCYRTKTEANKALAKVKKALKNK